MTNDLPPIELVVVPCLSDNYAFLVHNNQTEQTALVDAPEALPVRRVLQARGWALTDILITHHHDDHIGALADLRAGARVIGAARDAHRLPAIDVNVADGDMIEICGVKTHVMEVPGHTLGHVAYHMPDAGLVFTGDSLMALGCGRLFEGTAAQMWDSLQKLRALPADSTVCSGHEYTESNARFALSLDPDNAALISRYKRITAARAANRPTVPSALDDEIRTNPFLRADDPGMKVALTMTDSPDVDVFAEIRARKDRF
ncbi:hydroxyacylglutathione hydrolase [Yoonia sp.]|uniref:hydroxyacylglutathione hydrolase n=1 Tax=Yoonia sp. TaxID=2212373 RepID=UPI0019F95E0D|nr:hydroxyacylglutathione hydrolase [Yoonia sp.]MBE0412575.1 hydroxyacylglutathione hydrolase [Yoonia sp.]